VTLMTFDNLSNAVERPSNQSRILGVTTAQSVAASSDTWFYQLLGMSKVISFSRTQRSQRLVTSRPADRTGDCS